MPEFTKSFFPFFPLIFRYVAIKSLYMHISVCSLNISLYLPQPHTYEIPETLDVGSIVAGEMMSTVDDKDSTVDSYYFYLVDEDSE